MSGGGNADSTPAWLREELVHDNVEAGRANANPNTNMGAAMNNPMQQNAASAGGGVPAQTAGTGKSAAANTITNLTGVQMPAQQ